MLDAEGPVEAHLEQADLLALLGQVLDRLVGRLGAEPMITITRSASGAPT
jgi:hypothetical protein